MRPLTVRQLIEELEKNDPSYTVWAGLRDSPVPQVHLVYTVLRDHDRKLVILDWAHPSDGDEPCG